jgi:hypothetical protein
MQYQLPMLSQKLFSVTHLCCMFYCGYKLPMKLNCPTGFSSRQEGYIRKHAEEKLDEVAARLETYPR